MTEENTGGLVDDLELKNDDQEKIPETDSRAVETVRTDKKVETFDRPEGLPDELWDGELNDVNKTALLERYQKDQKQILDQRKIISKGTGKPPERVDEYQVEFDEDVSEFVKDDDKGLAVAKAAALEAGMPKDMFDKFAKNYMGTLLKEGLISKDNLPMTDEEIKADDDAFFEEQLKILGDEGKRTKDRVTQRVATLYEKGSLNKEDIEAFKNAAFDAKGVLFMDKWIALHGNEKMIPTDHVLDEGMATKEQLDSMAGDPRMSDPAFRAKRTAGYYALQNRNAL